MGEEVPASGEVLRPGGAPEDSVPPDEPQPSPPLGPLPASTDPELGDTSRSYVRHSAIMSVGTGLSRLTGFVRLAALAFALGQTESRLADAYNVANTTPNIIYELALGGILSSVFVPVFVEWLETRGRDEAWESARAVLTFTTVFLLAVMVVGIAASGLIIRAYTFDVRGPEGDAARAFASFALKWFMPQIVFYGIGAVATGLLNAHRRFAVPMFAPIVNNLLVSATFFLFAFAPHAGAHPTPSGITGFQRYLLVIGTTLGVVGMTAALWPSLRRLGFRWRWHWNLRDAGLRRVGRLARWAFLYVVVNQLGYLVVIILAYRVQGGYTAYTSAFIFFQLPHAIFAVSIMTALLPAMSSRWAADDRAAFRGLLSQGIRGTAFIVVPAAFGYLAMATPVVRLLVQHGATTSHSTQVIARILVFFSIGLFSFSCFQLLLRAFYAMQDTRTPALINIFAVGLNVVVDLIYFRYLKVEGLALGHATAYTFAAVTAAVILGRRIGGLEVQRLGTALGATLLGGLAAGGAAFAVSRWVGDVAGTSTPGPQLLQVASGVLAGIAAFLVVAVAFRMQELRMIRELVLGRFAGRRGGGRA